MVDLFKNFAVSLLFFQNQNLVFFCDIIGNAFYTKGYFLLEFA